MTVSLVGNASNSIIDDVWAWRADHGNAVGWTANKGDTDVFFQNELPYDLPSQAVWNESATFSGYPAFQVGSAVKTFHGYGMGSYVVFNQTSATLHVTEAFQAPTVPGVTFSDVFGVRIAGLGGLDSIVNGTGGPDNSTTPGTVGPVDVASYSG